MSDRAVAYIVGVFDTNTGVFLGAGLFSDSTPTLGARRYPVTLLEGRGEKFSEGVAYLRRALVEVPYLRWITRHLSDRDRSMLGLPAPSDPASALENAMLESLIDKAKQSNTFTDSEMQVISACLRAALPRVSFVR